MFFKQLYHYTSLLANDSSEWREIPFRNYYKTLINIYIYPHLPVPYIFGTRGLVVWYIGLHGSNRFQIYRELEDQGLLFLQHKMETACKHVFWIFCFAEDPWDWYIYFAYFSLFCMANVYCKHTVPWIGDVIPPNAASHDFLFLVWHVDPVDFTIFELKTRSNKNPSV